MRNSVRRATLVLALTPVISAPMVGVALATSGGTTTTTTTVTTPAPPADASASSVDIDGILTIGKATAHAGSTGGSSTATALAIGGQTISGGDNGSGNLIGTGDTPLGDAEVAPWSASHSGNGSSYQAVADAALAHVNLADVVQLWVLHSNAQAYWQQDQSHGDAFSDGAELNLADQLDVKVLHSEAHSNGKGKSDLLVINGNEIGSSDQANGQCDINAEPLLHLICLTASGGTGSTGVQTSGADVVTVDIGGGQLGGVISGSSSQGGVAGTPQAPKAHKPASGGQSSGARTPNGGGSPSGQGGLPFTGSDAQRLAALGLALASIGAAMTAFGRRVRRFATA